MKRFPPPLALLLLAPGLGELVSGHQCPSEFLNPLCFVALCLPYGLGALLCRELTVRWKKDWRCLLLLSLAYAIYEEAIVVRSLFNPRWHELGTMATYGFAGGVHWTFGFMLIYFHVIISMGASVILTGVLFPERRTQQWLSQRSFSLCVFGLAAWLPLGWMMTSFRPPWTHSAIAWSLLLSLVVLARVLPPSRVRTHLRTPPSSSLFFFLGTLSVCLVFVGISLASEAQCQSLPLTLTIIAAGTALTLILLLRWSGMGHAWNDTHRLAWVAGCLAFFICFNMIEERNEHLARVIVSLLATAGILLLWRIVRRRTTCLPQTPGRANINL